jgi:hypothetical protein
MVHLIAGTKVSLNIPEAETKTTTIKQEARERLVLFLLRPRSSHISS